MAFFESFVSQQLLILFSKHLDTMSNVMYCVSGQTYLWEKFITESIGRLRVTANPEQALATADLVVESVTENLELKKKLFASYDKVAPAKTIFASNTSSLAIRKDWRFTDNLNTITILLNFLPAFMWTPNFII